MRLHPGSVLRVMAWVGILLCVFIGPPVMAVNAQVVGPSGVAGETQLRPDAPSSHLDAAGNTGVLPTFGSAKLS